MEEEGRELLMHRLNHGVEAMGLNRSPQYGVDDASVWKGSSASLLFQDHHKSDGNLLLKEWLDCLPLVFEAIQGLPSVA